MGPFPSYKRVTWLWIFKFCQAFMNPEQKVRSEMRPEMGFLQLPGKGVWLCGFLSVSSSQTLLEAKWVYFILFFWHVSVLSVLLDLQFRNTQTTAPVMHLKSMICTWLFARAVVFPELALPGTRLFLPHQQHQLNLEAHKKYLSCGCVCICFFFF